jgi:hypothetical protein
VRDVGFYTTRAVHAASVGEAGHVAEETIWRELRKKLPAEHLVGGHLEVEEVEEVATWWRRFRPPHGFAWFMPRTETRACHLTSDASFSRLEEWVVGDGRRRCRTNRCSGRSRR